MKSVRKVVEGILEQVRRRGDKALVGLAWKFDKVKLEPREFLVGAQELATAGGKISPEVKRALEGAHRNIRRFHEMELRRMGGSWEKNFDGAVLGQRIVPLERVGIYAPGGRYSYPSTVLMSGTAARVAGVREIVLCTPPRGLTQAVLYAARLVGIDKVFRLGGAGAIAAMAYGTKTVPKVDLIAGPGNVYVTEAKRQVFGLTGIDMLAGPSEIVILADRSADAEYVISDLQAQAEHDPEARAYLVTDSAALLRRVRKGLRPVFRPQVKLELVKNMEEGVRKTDLRSPEHLQIMVKNPSGLLRHPWKAGAVFVGPYSSVVLGDYWAGPSHVLPTGGSARFSSGISVATFLRRSSLIRFSRPALRQAAPSIAALARAEGLEFHARAVLKRVS